MRKCIWCSRSNPQVSFDKRAHTFPKSLGGKNFCENVCDDCNHYFGSPKPLSPSVELVLKEILNISKYLLLTDTSKLPKGKRYKSEFFKIDWKRRKITAKPKYKLRRGFQEKLGRLFRRGIYKVYLEERERIKKDSHQERFNFIREFARYDLSDYPVYIFKPKFGAVLSSDELLLNPEISFAERKEEEEKNFGAHVEFLMGHVFCIPVIRNFENSSLERYQYYLRSTNHPFGVELIPIRKANDIDFTFSFLNNR
ncbi:HNH endonuclease [Flagellimonas onchidii]|uniref:HNH endonuclease n=1 Tax=Flagellimonas onchidii TaxID=2562684 RepID=UPI0010A64295|nr:HNH endonuclease [Allomuricauda onchidii]